jgi:hypothetical protein
MNKKKVILIGGVIVIGVIFFIVFIPTVAYFPVEGGKVKKVPLSDYWYHNRFSQEARLEKFIDAQPTVPPQSLDKVILDDGKSVNETLCENDPEFLKKYGTQEDYQKCLKSKN